MVTFQGKFSWYGKQIKMVRINFFNIYLSSIQGKKSFEIQFFILFFRMNALDKVN